MITVGKPREVNGECQYKALLEYISHTADGEKQGAKLVGLGGNC